MQNVVISMWVRINGQRIKRNKCLLFIIVQNYRKKRKFGGKNLYILIFDFLNFCFKPLKFVKISFFFKKIRNICYLRIKIRTKEKRLKTL